MTRHGATAFADLVDHYVSAITQLVEAEARRARGGGHEWTADHVAAAQAAHEHPRQGRTEEGAATTANLRTVSTIFVTAGAVGTPMMAPLLASPWQITLFIVFASVLVAGLVLSWTSRTRG